jgi:hypothetical protein
MSATHDAGRTRPPATFEVGQHQVRVWVADGRWGVAVDEGALAQWYMTQADAWTAGVSEAYRLDAAKR